MGADRREINLEADIVICGAGIAGISAAYYLAVENGINDILLVDENPPLTLTSDKSSECYRNWWPDRSMIGLMNRSIDLLEQLARQSRNTFHLSRRGYLYVTADQRKIGGMTRSSEEIAAMGAGPIRIHKPVSPGPVYIPASPEGYESGLSGADLILDPDLIREHFPYLADNAAAALHVRRAGWFSAQQLGMYLLEQVRRRGVRLLRERVTGLDKQSGRVQAVRLESGGSIKTNFFINAAGPYLREVGRMLEVELPVFNELHQKAAFKDTRRVIPREAPLLIWTDSQKLPWSAEERELLLEEAEMDILLDELPPGAHTRPEGGPDSPIVLMLWEYKKRVLNPEWPPPIDPAFPEVVLRGLATMIPDLQHYFNKSERIELDAGYYTKTKENRPLVGPLPVQGAYVIGALSGYGLMAACAAGELLALHLTGKPLPPYAPAFSLDRYQDPEYLAAVEALEDSGQL
jgi:sarcosine oxidase, subunit beta